MTKTQLLAEIEKNWQALNTALSALTYDQLTAIRDEQGWTVKDHLFHMARWERSAMSLLQGQPRHNGLGISETLYLQDSTDAINAEIFRQVKDAPLADAFVQFRSTHEQLFVLLESLSDADLQKSYRHYLPDEPGEGDGPPAIQLVYGNTAGHFIEHLAWIEALAGSNSTGN